MIVMYDKNKALSTDQKLDSLITSIQLALNELIDRQYETDKKIEELKASIETLRNS